MTSQSTPLTAEMRLAEVIPLLNEMKVALLPDRMRIDGGGLSDDGLRIAYTILRAAIAKATGAA
jgi:hypothetical protein